MNSVLYDVSYVGLGNIKMGYYLPFYCWREVSFEGQSASIHKKHLFLHEKKFPGLILRSQNSWGSLKTQSRKGLRGYQEWHNSYRARKHGTGTRGSLSIRKPGGNIRVMAASPPHWLYPKPLLFWFQVLLTHRCRLRVHVFSGIPDSCGLTESFLLTSPRFKSLFYYQL